MKALITLWLLAVAADGNGNITCLLNTNQTIVAKYLYDPFGNILSQSGLLGDENVYRFSSEEFHDASGLCGYLRRFYDPKLQRWLNRDPIGEAGGINPYGFVVNDPLSLCDPLGLDPSFLQLFGQSVYNNGWRDAQRFYNRLNSATLNLLTGTVEGAFRLATDPEGLARGAYQGVANAGAYLGRLSASPCERRRAMKALEAYLSTPEAYADATFALESLLGGGLLSGVARAGEVSAAESTAPKLLAPYTGYQPWAGEIRSVTAASDTTMYRVWGGGSQQAGAWLSPIRPTTAASATESLALPSANTAQFYSEVLVPAGTRYQIGTAAAANGLGGGGVQVQLLERIPLGNYGPGIPLPPH